MKWINAKDTPPDTDNYYIVRLASDEENTGDFMYIGLWNMNGSWSFSDETIETGWQLTHYIIPDRI